MKMYERAVNRFKRHLYVGAGILGGSTLGVTLGVYATKYTDSGAIVFIGTVVPTILGMIIGDYIDQRRARKNV